MLQRVKLLYFVGQWFYLQGQGATQTVSVCILGDLKSYSVPRGCSNHLGFYSAGIGRVGIAYMQIHKSFEDTQFLHRSYENEFWLKSVQQSF